MTASASRVPIGAGASDPDCFRRPLEVIRSDHDRQEQLCDRLEAIVDDREPRPIADWGPALLAYLTQDLALHTEDEEVDLFPMLERRCRPEDGIDEILAQLSREHTLDRDLAAFIVADLEPIVGGMRLSPPVRFFINARAFAETQRRHIAWENRLVLPLADQRLGRADLEALGRNMAARRGIAYPD